MGNFGFCMHNKEDNTKVEKSRSAQYLLKVHMVLHHTDILLDLNSVAMLGQAAGFKSYPIHKKLSVSHNRHNSIQINHSIDSTP